MACRVPQREFLAVLSINTLRFALCSLRFLVFEMASSGEDHGDVELVTGFNNNVVVA